MRIYMVCTVQNIFVLWIIACHGQEAIEIQVTFRNTKDKHADHQYQILKHSNINIKHDYINTLFKHCIFWFFFSFAQ